MHSLKIEVQAQLSLLVLVVLVLPVQHLVELVPWYDLVFAKLQLQVGSLSADEN